MKTIEITDVGAVQRLSIPVRPGLVVLAGANGRGKSTALRAVEALVSGDGSSLEVRDGAGEDARGVVEGCGARLTVGRRRESATATPTGKSRVTGMLEVRTLDGVNPLEFVEPNIADPKRADARRFAVLCELGGIKGEFALFEAALGKDITIHATAATRDKGSLPEQGAALKRDLHTAARDVETALATVDGKIQAHLAASGGVDGAEPTDEPDHDATHTEALRAFDRLQGEAAAASRARSAAARNGGDCLADARTAALLARRLLELGVSAICDIYELPRHEQVLFVRRFLEALIGAPRALWYPTLVVVDEAHIFCPEKGKAESAGAVIDLMTRGRKRGFCGVLATQRLSKLHKDAAAEANVKLIGRTGLDVDMKRAGEELGFTSAEQRLSLRNLPPGRFFTFGPGVSNEVLDVHVGDVVTTHPRPGARATPIPPARDKVKKVLEQLADLPKEAAEEARSIEELRKANAALKRELAARPVEKVPEVKVERVEVPIVEKAVVERIESLAGALLGGLQRADDLKAAAAALRDTVQAAARVNGHAVAQARPRPTPAAPVRDSSRVQRRASAPAATGEGQGARLGAAHRAMLSVLANRHGKTTTRNQLGVMSGYSTKSSHLDNTISSLRTAGHVTGGRDDLAITDGGLAALGSIDSLPTGAALVDYWVREVGKAPGAMLRAIVDAHPGTLTRDEVAHATGYSTDSSHVDNSLSLLRTLELIAGGRDALKANADLFD